MVFGRVRIHNANNNPRRNRKADKDFAKEVDFKDTKFPFKLELFTKKKKKKRIISALMFLVMKTKKNIQYKCQKILAKRRVDLLLIEVEGKRNNVLIKDFNTFKYDHTLSWKKKLLPLLFASF